MSQDIVEPKLNIIQVDDEFRVRRFMAAMLKAHNLTQYEDPLMTLEDIRRNAGLYDLLITDYKMRGIDGWRLAKEATKADPDLPIVLVSGSFTEAEEARSSGLFREVVIKPFSPRVILDILTTIPTRAR